MTEKPLQLILRDASGHQVSKLLISNLPDRADIAFSADGDVALREGATYRYEIESSATSVAIEPRELFDPDDGSWKRGRLNPAQAVGRLQIQIIDPMTSQTGTTEVDVLAIKLDHETEYRQMLTDISSFAAEAVLQGFAPSSIDLAPSEMPAELLYLRFAMIAAYLQDPVFEAAITRIMSQPHRTWISEREIRPVGSPFPSGAAFRRAIRAPGRRVRWDNGPATLTSLPAHLARERTEASVDNPANQFIKFALETWRAVATELLYQLSGSSQTVETGPLRRGRQTAALVAAQLDEYLAHPLFQDVTSLARMPTSDQILLKRAGYREIFRTFAITESGAIFQIDRGETSELLAASQRNIATLYELWCYLAVINSIGRVCGEDRTTQVFKASGNGLSMTIRSDLASKISWSVKRGGRSLRIAAFFNRSFAGADNLRGSWSQTMRPDCSIRIRPQGSTPARVFERELEVWLHFDAKYRVGNLLAQLAPEPEVDDPISGAIMSSSAKREDLLKMHAYRDAISRTVGAYVLYPGSQAKNIRRHPGFNEVLPGLGAFPLRPSADGLAASSQTLDQFIGDVLTHVASQVTRDERYRFWSATVDRPGPSFASPLTTDFLEEPPADTDVLLGLVRSAEHRSWIERVKKYNIRAGDRTGAVKIGGRELGARLILLYERQGGTLRVAYTAKVMRWSALTAADLIASGYPSPKNDLYFVADIELDRLPDWAHSIDLEALVPQTFDEVPVLVTWLDIVRAASPAAT